jgi:RHS repeat-associated protein
MLSELPRLTTSTSTASQVAVLNGSALYDLHTDRLGTPQFATDSTQNIQWQASYQPFGETSSVSGTITQNLRLPGQYFDSESGWNHNGFRNYLSDLGRYAEPDPLAMQGSSRFYDPLIGRFVIPNTIAVGISGYAYVGDDPIDYIDPLGMSSTCKKPKCFAQLKYRSVDDKRTKFFDRNHAFWYVQASNGKQYIISAGPIPPNGGNQMLNIFPPNPNIHTNVDNITAGTSWNSGLSEAICAGVDAMIKAALAWPQNAIPYSAPFSPNSDTAAHYLGTKGGFNPPAPPGMAGWDTPLPPIAHP